MARGRQCFEPALVNRLGTTRANAVTSLFNPEQRLIYVGNHLRLTLAESHRKLLMDVLQRHINAIFDAVVRRHRFERGGLTVANILRMSPQLLLQYAAKVLQSLCFHVRLLTPLVFLL